MLRTDVNSVVQDRGIVECHNLETDHELTPRAPGWLVEHETLEVDMGFSEVGYPLFVNSYTSGI